MIHALYFGVFSIWGIFRKSCSFEDTDKLSHFAVLIPARNEESVIGNLVDSIKNSDYSGPLDIYVVVNHCSDDTAKIASERGAEVINCTDDSTKSKADVLRFAFSALADRRDIDAYVIFDADNVVDPAFFTEINKAFAKGAAAVQCRRTGKIVKNNWVSSCYEMYYAMQNAFFNHPRSSAGLSASINGTGWVVRKDIIDKQGFDYDTITEDFEMTLRYALDGRNIAYCPEAVVYDEFTKDLRVSIIQRVRWTFGMVQCLRKYGLTLLGKGLRGSWQCFDAAMVAFLPVVALLSLIGAALGYFVLPIPIGVIPFILFLIVSFWIGLGMGCLVAVLKSRSSLKHNYKGILAFPIFILTWVPILISCFFRRSVEWTPIKHTESISISERESAND